MELLESAFGQTACSYTDIQTRRTTVASYFEKKPDWSAPKRAQIAAGMGRIKRCGLEGGSWKVSLTRVRRENWAESWKRHFKPLEIGPALLIKPGWSRRRARKGQAVVVLDPGLSFGTGQHPTTAFCLEQLVARRKGGMTQSCLDIGAGSGILAIAADKLGCAPVHGFDNDPEAVAIARANARRNHTSANLRFFQQDLTRLPCPPRRRYSLICANLISTLLVECLGRILTRLEPGGTLVMAGILKEEFPRVHKACQAAGLRMVASRTRKDWRSASFQRAASVRPDSNFWSSVNSYFCKEKFR